MQAVIQHDEHNGTKVAPARRNLRVVAPRVDIYETENHFVLLADMPGVPAEAVNVTVEKNVLTLEAEAQPLRSAEERLVHVEFRPRLYRRAFTLSQGVDSAHIEATVKQGVLQLLLPKLEPARRVTIKVQSE